MLIFTQYPHPAVLTYIILHDTAKFHSDCFRIGQRIIQAGGVVNTPGMQPAQQLTQPTALQVVHAAHAAQRPPQAAQRPPQAAQRPIHAAQRPPQATFPGILPTVTLPPPTSNGQHRVWQQPAVVAHHRLAAV